MPPGARRPAAPPRRGEQFHPKKPFVSHADVPTALRAALAMPALQDATNKVRPVASVSASASTRQRARGERERGAKRCVAIDARGRSPG